MLCCFRAADSVVSVNEAKKRASADAGVKQESQEDEPEKSQKGDKAAGEKGAGGIIKSSFLLSTGPRTNPNTSWLKENMAEGLVEDKYDAKKMLGKGAYATVWSATRKNSRDYVAIKSINFEDVKKDKLERTLAQITAESRVHVKMKHQCVMRLEEFYLTRTKLYLVLELMKGGSLLDLILERGGLNEAEAKIVFRQVFSGLQYLHQQNVIHRDIKLENIMLGDVNDLETVKIADFGFAVQLETDEDRRKVASLAGTPVYMSPESVESMMGQKKVEEVLTSALDMWAAGVALYMLVGGFPPFEGKSSKEIFRNIYKCNVSFKEPAWRNVSDDCISIVTGLLTRNMSDRLTATSALQHKWIRDTVLPEDFSKTLLPPNMTEGESKLKFPSKSGLERLNSNKMEDSIYIKKSTLLEIQERHENEGHGMDMSLLRIFQDNKNKVKPTKQSTQKAPPERQASLGTLISSIAGPPRYDEEHTEAGMSVGPGASVMTSGLYSQDCSVVSDDPSDAPRRRRASSARSEASSARSTILMGAGVPSLARKATAPVRHGAAAAFAPAASPSARGQRNPNKLFGRNSSLSDSLETRTIYSDSPEPDVGLASERSHASQDAVEISTVSQPLVAGSVAALSTKVSMRKRPVHGRASPRCSPALSPEVSAADNV